MRNALFAVFIFAILLFGCTGCGFLGGGTKFVCPDGREVSDSSQCGEGGPAAPGGETSGGPLQASLSINAPGSVSGSIGEEKTIDVSVATNLPANDVNVGIDAGENAEAEQTTVNLGSISVGSSKSTVFKIKLTKGGTSSITVTASGSNTDTVTSGISLSVTDPRQSKTQEGDYKGIYSWKVVFNKEWYMPGEQVKMTVTINRPAQTLDSDHGNLQLSATSSVWGGAEKSIYMGGFNGGQSFRKTVDLTATAEDTVAEGDYEVNLYFSGDINGIFGTRGFNDNFATVSTTIKNKP